MTGIDITPAFLEQARRNAVSRGLEVEWHERDMRELPLRKEFEAALCIWGSFGYFDDAGNETFANAVAAVLKPGAGFVLDLPVMETTLPQFQERAFHRHNDMIILEERHFDIDASRVDVAWTLIKGETVQTRHSSIRIYTYHELVALLRSAGFVDFEAYDAMAEGPFKFGAKRLLLVARKGEDKAVAAS